MEKCPLLLDDFTDLFNGEDDPGFIVSVHDRDHSSVVINGIAQLINRQSDLMVCGEEEDASNALSAIERLKPNLVIADISLKESSGQVGS